MPLTVSSDGTAHSCSAWRIGCAPGVSAEELLRTVRLRDAMCKVVEHLEGDGRDRYIANCLSFVAILLKRDIVSLSVDYHTRARRAGTSI